MVTKENTKSFWEILSDNVTHIPRIFLHLNNFISSHYCHFRKKSPQECKTLQLKPYVLILFQVLSEGWTLSCSMQYSLCCSTAIQLQCSRSCCTTRVLFPTYFTNISDLRLDGQSMRLSFLLRLWFDRSSRPEFFCKKYVLKNFLKLTGKLRPEACNFIKKEALAQRFSYEFREISTNTFFRSTPLVAASVFS